MPKITVVVDVETTGNNDPDVIQICAVETRPPLAPVNERIRTLVAYFNSRKAFEPGALAVHNILPEDVAGFPEYRDSEIYRFFADQVEYVIGHNIDSDAGAMGLQSVVKRICTLAIARRLWPSYSHKLAALVYALTPPAEWSDVRDVVRKAHNAVADVELTCRLLDFIYEARPELKRATDFEPLYRFSERCRLPDRMPIGKHGRRPECPEGDRLVDIPPGYIQWAFKNMTSIDPYLRHSLYLVHSYGQQAAKFFDIDSDVEVPALPLQYQLPAPAELQRLQEEAGAAEDFQPR